MAVWEIDIVVRVRKTLTFSGPVTEKTARALAEHFLRGDMDISSIVKWEPDNHGYGRHPVETIVDNEPQIVAVREVAADG